MHPYISQNLMAARVKDLQDRAAADGRAREARQARREARRAGREARRARRDTPAQPAPARSPAPRQPTPERERESVGGRAA